VDVEGRLYLSDRAHLVLSYHKLVDKESAASKAIGTTARGIGPAYEDKVARRGVRVLDLRHPGAPAHARGARHRAPRTSCSRASARPNARKSEFTMSALEALAPRLLAIADDVGLAVHRAIKSGASVLLEGAQGSLAGCGSRHDPFVTSSSTTAGGAAIGVGIGPRTIDEAIGVVKAYTTRVGAGPLPTEFDEVMGEHVRKLGNEFGATTGRPRRCGWFDAVVVRYAVRINGLTSLAVTKLDVLDTLEKIAICTGYEFDGNVVEEFPGGHCRARRDSSRGWSGSTVEAGHVGRAQTRRSPREGARVSRSYRGAGGVPD